MKASETQINSDGGPSAYYDFQKEWKTWNDLADYKAERQWKEHSFHLGNIGKAIFRWGEKSGTSKEYDAKKITYSALRVLNMLKGKEETNKYLRELLNDPQFQYDTVDEGTRIAEPKWTYVLQNTVPPKPISYPNQGQTGDVPTFDSYLFNNVSYAVPATARDT